MRAVAGALTVGSALILGSLGGVVAALVNVATVAALAVLLMSGARRRDVLRRTRWLLLCALAAAFVSGLMPVGYRAVVGHAPALPWLSDLVALFYVPFTFAGLLCIPSASRREGFRARAMADAGPKTLPDAFRVALQPYDRYLDAILAALRRPRLHGDSA